MSLKPPAVAEALDLAIVIRFSASLPDLQLSIPPTQQSYANTSTLKQLIREQLPSTYASRRIRLIHSGKALSDDALLSTSLKRPLSHPPSRASTPSQPPTPTPHDVKGKAPIRDTPAPAVQRIYIHCSIGDLVLTPTELADEARLGAHRTAQDGASQQHNNNPPREGRASRDDAETTAHIPPPAPAPRGFDRLLTAGFTPSEVSALRIQFLSIQAHTHTPDSMPTPAALRALEDAWLDGGGGGGDADGDDASTNPGQQLLLSASSEESEAGQLDDMIYGTAMGFFWPIGCLMWAVREEGVWTERRKMAVVVGVLLNVALGFLRFTG
jgi:iron-sulfur cluster assembly 1